LSGTDIDLRALAEVLADVLIERGLVVDAAPRAGRVLNAAGVAMLLGRDRQWVYDHADELGAFRYGDGPRARLGFDASTVEQWKRSRRRHPNPTRHGPKILGRGLNAELIRYEGSGRGA
jgi:hypothetical protein